MNNHLPKEVKPKTPLLCRVFGHKWKPSHRSDIQRNGMPAWVYIDDICTRCYTTEWRMPRGRDW